MKLQVNEIKKIAVFRALQLGDMLCHIPAMRALRAAYPNAEIYLIGLPWARAFVDRFDKYFDGFLHFPGFPGIPEQAFDPLLFTEFLQRVQTMRFDLVLQMQGNGTLVNPLMELFAAKHTAGFATDGHYAPANGLYIPYPNDIHEIQRHIRLMEHLGINSAGVALEFPLSAADRSELRNLELGIKPQQYVCVHPGSRGSWRQWPPGNFAALADYCAEEGYRIIITGTDGERNLVNDVIDHMRNTAIDLCGQTSLAALGVLIEDAAMLVSNCTGVSHVAAALNTPSIVLSMDGEPRRWGPLDTSLHRTIDWLTCPDFNLILRETVDLLAWAR